MSSGGGLLQLVAQGTEDQFLVGNPQITFFKVVFRRHTNFSVESVKQQFSGNPTFGEDVVAKIKGGDLLYKVLFDLKHDVTEMKRVIVDLINNNELSNNEKSAIITRLHNTNDDLSINSEEPVINQYKIEHQTSTDSFQGTFQESVEIEESLSLEEREKELIQKALKKHNGRRKNAAKELGISERTLYRKIKEYEILK